MSSARHYTEAEDDTIRRHYPTATSDEWASLLPGRSVHGISVRASRLGVQKDVNKWEYKRCCWRTSIEPSWHVAATRDHTQFDASETRNGGFASSIYKTPAPTTIIGHLSDIERAYLAGIVDGEGCIQFHRRNAKDGRKPVYVLAVSIANTSPALLDWLETRLPHRAYIHRHTHSKPQWRDRYDWVLSGNRQVLIFLKEITPYLVIKKEQAILLGQGYLHLSDESRSVLFEKMRDLKRTA